MSSNSTTARFPRSLEQSVAVDDLARALYCHRCRYVGIPEDGWSVVPYHVRAALLEYALRVLKELGDPSETASTEALYQLNNDLARLEARRSNIIGSISPEVPYGRAVHD